MIYQRCACIVLVFSFALSYSVLAQNSMEAILSLPFSELKILNKNTGAKDSLSRIMYALGKKNLKSNIQEALLLFDEAMILAKNDEDLDFTYQIKKSKALAYINLQQMDQAATCPGWWILN